MSKDIRTFFKSASTNTNASVTSNGIVTTNTNASVNKRKRHRNEEEYDESDPHTQRQKSIASYIITGNEEIHLLIARAGCTKTSTIIMTVDEIKKRIPDVKILYVTYNSAMKDEARQKLRRIIGEQVKTNVHSYDSLIGYIMGVFNNKATSEDKSKITLTTDVYKIIPCFEYIFIDEAQDLSPQFFYVINILHLHNPNAKFIFCGDPHQNLYDFRKDSLKADHRLITLSNQCGSFIGKQIKTHELFVSKRVTSSIAKVISNGLYNDPLFLQSTKNGCKVELHETRNIGRELFRKVTNLIQGGVHLKDIVVLVPTRNFIERNTSFIKCVDNNFRVRLASSEKDATQKELNIQTFHSSKGLEWDFVFVLPFDESLFNYKNFSHYKESNDIPNALYVAMSRAKIKLFLLGNPQQRLQRFNRKNCENDIDIIYDDNDDNRSKLPPPPPPPPRSMSNSNDDTDDVTTNDNDDIIERTHLNQNKLKDSSRNIARRIDNVSFQHYIEKNIEINEVEQQQCYTNHFTEVANKKLIVQLRNGTHQIDAQEIIREALIFSYEIISQNKNPRSTLLYQFCYDYFVQNKEYLERSFSRDKYRNVIRSIENLNHTSYVDINKLIILKTCISSMDFQNYNQYPPGNYEFLCHEDFVKLSNCVERIISITPLIQQSQLIAFQGNQNLKIRRDFFNKKDQMLLPDDETPKFDNRFNRNFTEYEIACMYDSKLRLQTGHEFILNFSMGDSNFSEILNSIMLNYNFLNTSLRGILIANVTNGKVYRIHMVQDHVCQFMKYIAQIEFCHMSFSLKRNTTVNYDNTKLDDESYVPYVNQYLTEGDSMYGYEIDYLENDE